MSSSKICTCASKVSDGGYWCTYETGSDCRRNLNFLALYEDSNEKEFLLPDSFSRNQIRAVEGLLLDYNGLLVLEMDSGSNAIKVVKKNE